MAAMGGSVARRYARALFDLGVDKGTFEAMGRELDELAELYLQSNELRQTLENPVFKMAEKTAILGHVLQRLGGSREVQSFALLLVDRNRINTLPKIARAYREMMDARLGRVRAVVTSAKALDATASAEIQRALERRTGKKVLMTTEVDPTLIGGVIARVGDLVLDGSLRTRLASIGDRILN